MEYQTTHTESREKKYRNLGNVGVCMFSGFYVTYVWHSQRTPNTYKTREVIAYLYFGEL